MVEFIIAGFAVSFIVVIINELVALRWWKAPLSAALSAVAFILLGHKVTKDLIVLICGSSFLSLLLLLIAEKLSSSPFPAPPVARRR